MKQMIRYFVLDIRKGTVMKWRLYAAYFLLVLGLSFLNETYYEWSILFGPDNAMTSFPLSLGDLLIVLFAGRDVYYPTSGMPFWLPVSWMFIVLMALYLTLDYPSFDLRSVGTNTLVRGKSRTAWWIGKSLWVIASVLLFCLLVLLAAVVVVVINGGELSLGVHTELPQVLGFNLAGLTGSPWDVGLFLLSIPVLLCSLCLVQMFLSFVIHPLPSFGCMAVILFLSAYFDLELLPGEYLMAARNAIFEVGGFRTEIGLVFAFALGVWATMCGALIFRYRDLFGKEQS